VAARRIRSALRTFAPLLDSESLAGLRADVVWAAGVLGSERDLDVVEIRLLADLDAMESGAAQTKGEDRAAVEAVRSLIVRTMASRRDQAHKLVLEAINSDRWRSMLDQLVELAHDPPTTARADKAAARVLPGLASKQWKSLSERAKHLTDADPDESWHHARISAKRARYAAEACAPAMGGEPARFAKALAEVTELLGDLQDTTVSRTLVHELADSVEDPDLVFVLGRLHAHEEAAAEQLRHDFPLVWKRAARPRLRRWLRG
jgi:CHAD domain-containing protein